MSQKLVRMQLAPALAHIMDPWKVYDRCVECGTRLPFPLLWRAQGGGIISQPSCCACLGLGYLAHLMDATEPKR